MHESVLLNTSSGHMASFLSSVESWPCPTCTADNAPSSTECEVCEGPRPASQLGAAIAVGNGSLTWGWSCATCTLDNTEGSPSCAGCGNPRTGEVATGAAADDDDGAEAAAAAAAAEAADKAVAEALAVEAGISAEWACSLCTFRNGPATEVCASCDTGHRPAADMWLGGGGGRGGGGEGGCSSGSGGGGAATAAAAARPPPCPCPGCPRPRGSDDEGGFWEFCTRSCQDKRCTHGGAPGSGVGKIRARSPSGPEPANSLRCFHCSLANGPNAVVCAECETPLMRSLELDDFEARCQRDGCNKKQRVDLSIGAADDFCSETCRRDQLRVDSPKKCALPGCCAMTRGKGAGGGGGGGGGGGNDYCSPNHEQKAQKKGLLPPSEPGEGRVYRAPIDKEGVVDYSCSELKKEHRDYVTVRKQFLGAWEKEGVVHVKRVLRIRNPPATEDRFNAARAAGRARYQAALCEGGGGDGGGAPRGQLAVARENDNGRARRAKGRPTRPTSLCSTAPPSSAVSESMSRLVRARPLNAPCATFSRPASRCVTQGRVHRVVR